MVNDLCNERTLKCHRSSDATTMYICTMYHSDHSASLLVPETHIVHGTSYMKKEAVDVRFLLFDLLFLL